MGIFEDWYIKARSNIYKLGSKAGKYLDISKLKIKRAECENDIGIKFQRIGEIFYNKIENDEFLDKADVLEFVKDINALKKEKKEYDAKINSLKGKRVCKFCNSLNSAGAQFCSSCGNSLTYNENMETTNCDNVNDNDVASNDTSSEVDDQDDDFNRFDEE